MKIHDKLMVTVGGICACEAGGIQQFSDTLQPPRQWLGTIEQRAQTKAAERSKMAAVYDQDTTTFEERERAAATLEADPTCEHLWEAIVAFAGYPFTTAKGLEFTYIVKQNRDGGIGNEIFFSRKEKGITRATVELAFRKALELRTDQAIPAVVSGPKKLGVFGASYIYPLFLKMGVIRSGKVSPHPPLMFSQD